MINEGDQHELDVCQARHRPVEPGRAGTSFGDTLKETPRKVRIQVINNTYRVLDT